MTPEQRKHKLELIAEEVYDAMRFERANTTLPWVEGGNSFAQSYARCIAANILDLIEEKDTE